MGPFKRQGETSFLRLARQGDRYHSAGMPIEGGKLFTARLDGHESQFGSTADDYAKVQPITDKSEIEHLQ